MSVKSEIRDIILCGYFLSNYKTEDALNHHEVLGDMVAHSIAELFQVYDIGGKHPELFTDKIVAKIQPLIGGGQISLDVRLDGDIDVFTQLIDIKTLISDSISIPMMDSEEKAGWLELRDFLNSECEKYCKDK